MKCEKYHPIYSRLDFVTVFLPICFFWHLRTR